MSIRLGGKLTSATDWTALVNGDVDAIRLSGFATTGECHQLASAIVRHTRTAEYATAAGVIRLGSSFSDIRKRDKVDDEYSRPDVLVEFLDVSPAVARLFGQVSASWPLGVSTLRHTNAVLHRFVARRILHGAAPHNDNIAEEIPANAQAALVTCQLGVNLYVEVPEAGGQLTGWRQRLTAQQYDALRDPDPSRSYGLRREALGEPDWEILPQLGDLIVFRNSEIHAIGDGSHPRATCGFFVGFQDVDSPLLLWS